jgi:hypothetical protein
VSTIVSRGQDEGQRAHRRVGVADDAAAHAAGVVGDHPADGGDVGAGRVGPELAADAAQSTRLTWPRTVPGLTRAALPPSSTATREVAPHVDEDAVGLTLAVEAGAAAAEDDRDAARPP